MIMFKACPRCTTGDLGLSEDIHGKYMQCFQCGHVIYPRDEKVAFKAPVTFVAKERVAA